MQPYYPQPGGQQPYYGGGYPGGPQGMQQMPMQMQPGAGLSPQGPGQQQQPPHPTPGQQQMAPHQGQQTPQGAPMPGQHPAGQQHPSQPGAGQAIPPTMPMPIPQAGPIKPRPPEPFKTGLFGCYTDVAICFLGWCFPCVLYGDNYARVHNRSFWLPCCLYALLPCLTCIFAGRTRNSIRIKYSLHEQPCSDCCVHCWCSPCGICQEARELKIRG